MDIQTDRALVPATAPAVRYCTVTISAPTPASGDKGKQRPAMRVAFVIDRSGSMANSKLAMAKKAVGHAMCLLNDRDETAVVCYDDKVDVLLGATSATKEAKTLAAKRLRDLDARGSTDLAAGWRSGAGQLLDERHADAADRSPARLLLLTDGLANQGETNPDMLAATATGFRQRGIVTSTFGIGADFDERLMSRLATAGGGHFYFIEQAAQIPDFFTSELGEALDIVARDVTLVLRDSMGAKTTCLNDFVTDHDVDGVHVKLGDLSAGQEVTLVLATEINAKAEGASTSILLRVEDRERVLYGAPMEVSWRSVDSDADRNQPVSRHVTVAAATQLAERARAEALELNRVGAFDRAIKVLAAAAAKVRAMAADVPAVQAIANDLEDVAPQYSEAMAPMMLKQEFFEAHTARRGRDKTGRAFVRRSS